MTAQAQRIVTSLAGANLQTTTDTEIVALIAYLQRLGREGKAYLPNQREGGE
jgi:cbb3-type cytochrome oxidase cytochrome c subunit